MSTIDPSGAIHGSDGKFTGHVAGEADDSVSLTSGSSSPGNPLDDDATLEAVERRNLALARSLDAIEDQINNADADLAVKDFAAQLARAERDTPSIRDAQVATVFVDRSDVDGRIVLTLCPDATTCTRSTARCGTARRWRSRNASGWPAAKTTWST
ncbi:hypothetical protein [Branchiibius cervicis]|uniref:Uncharacterized protein n=1 Tax=Branchiibius cervicis TaxID=908252 RepID=A0ABW2AT99_9MICO